MTHLSLFTGIGGMDIAAEWAGFRTVGQCEWADYPTRVLEKHWPDVPRWRDIRTLTGGDFYARTGLRTVDIVSGGFPCPPFSVAGKRRGKADDRYLWHEMRRVVSELLPSWVIGENVAGLVSMAEPVGHLAVESREVARHADEDHYSAVYAQQEHMLIVEIVEDLESLGYDVQAFVIPACGVDAPHRRDRIAIVGHSERSGLCGEPRGRARAESENRHLDVAEGPLADADSTGTQGGAQTGDAASGGPKTDKLPGRCGVVGDSTSPRLQDGAENAMGGQKPQPQPKRPNWRTAQPGLGRMADGLPDRLDGGWWPDEPNIPRIASGVPDRVERLKALGNAVVPQQFYPIFAAIAEVIGRTRDTSD